MSSQDDVVCRIEGDWGVGWFVDCEHVAGCKLDIVVHLNGDFARKGGLFNGCSNPDVGQRFAHSGANLFETVSDELWGYIVEVWEWAEVYV